MTTILQVPRCLSCGASVPVTAGARFTDCAYCGARLELPRTGTEEELLRAENEALKLREQLRELDASWEKHVQQASRKDHRGIVHPPGAVDTNSAVLLFIVVGAVVGFVGCPSPLVWALTVTAFATGIMWVLVTAASRRQRAFDAARRAYDQRRSELSRRLAELEQAQASPALPA